MKAKDIKKYIPLFTMKCLAVVLVFTACNKDFPNILKEFGGQPDYNSGASKVLYVIADGVRGKALQQLELPNFRIIGRNSLHSFGSLGDFKGNNFTKEMGLANLLTGVTSDKHLVTGSDLSVANTADYPTLLTRINSKSSDLSSAVFTTNERLSTGLLKDADKNSLVGNDGDVLSQVNEELATGNSDFIVAHFSEVNQVGLDNSFETTDVAYVAALKEFDNSLGALIASIKSRKTYAQEDWLIIVTSSIGGEAVNQEVDNTAYGDNERNTFTYLYSPKFSRSLLTRPNSTEIPFDGNGVKFTYSAGAARAESISKDAFNYDGATDFTVNFFYKQSVAGVQNYPCILNKRESFDEGNGWQILLSGGGPEFCSHFSGKIKGANIDDALWHSVTIVVSRSGSADSSKIFVDGVLGAKATANATAITTMKPLTIGKVDGFNYDNADFMINNLQVYKGVAFTNAEVAKYHGITQISEANMPYFSKLTGYWPGYSDIGNNRLKDISAAKNDLLLSGPYSWLSYSDVVKTFQPPITESFYKLVPNSVDLPFFVYQWFGIVPKASWGLEGKSWTPNLLVSVQ